MDTTRFDLLAAVFTVLGLLGLPRLLRGWRALFAREPSEEGRALAVYVAVFLAVPLATLAHELGHLVVARALGAWDATLHYRIFWGFVQYSTRLPGHGDWWVALAGNAVSWALAASGLWYGTTHCVRRAEPATAVVAPSPDPPAAPAGGTEGEATPAAEPTSPKPVPASAAAAPAAVRAPDRPSGPPPGVCEAARVFGILEIIHTLIAYPLMCLTSLPGADWSVIYGHPFWAGTWVVAAAHVATLIWLWRVLRSGVFD